MVLARHLEAACAQHTDAAACLELGAGTGLAGLAAAAALQVCAPASVPSAALATCACAALLTSQSTSAITPAVFSLARLGHDGYPERGRAWLACGVGRPGSIASQEPQEERMQVPVVLTDIADVLPALRSNVSAHRSLAALVRVECLDWTSADLERAVERALHGNTGSNPPDVAT